MTDGRRARVGHDRAHDWLQPPSDDAASTTIRGLDGRPHEPTPWLRPAPSSRCPTCWRAASSQPSPRAAAAGIARARVSPPMLPLVAAALWRSRAGAEPRGLAMVVADDDAARSLIDEASPLPARRAGRATCRRAAARLRQRHRPGAAPGRRALPRAGRAGRGRPGRRLGRRAARAGARRRPPGPGRWTLELGSEPGLESCRRAAGGRRVHAGGHGRGAGRGVGARRPGRRLPDHRPRAAADRVLRRRDRAAVRVLGVHPAVDPRAGARRSSTRPASPDDLEQRPGARTRTRRRRCPAGWCRCCPS